MTKVLGITLVVLALAISIIPSFTDCASQGSALTLASGKQIPMKCHWTAKAEIAVGVPLLAVGAMTAANRRKQALMAMGIVGGVLGLSAILLTTNSLIGVCTTPTMICHTVMKPAMTVLGSGAIAASLGIVVLARKASD